MNWLGSIPIVRSQQVCGIIVSAAAAAATQPLENRVTEAATAVFTCPGPSVLGLSGAAVCCYASLLAAGRAVRALSRLDCTKVVENTAIAVFLVATGSIIACVV